MKSNSKFTASIAEVICRNDSALTRDLRYLRKKGPKTDDSLSVFFISGILGRKCLFLSTSEMAEFRSAALSEVFNWVSSEGRLLLFNHNSDVQLSYSWTNLIDDCIRILKVSYSTFIGQITEIMHVAIGKRRSEISRLELTLDSSIVAKILSDLDFADRVLKSKVITENDLSKIIRTSISPGFIKKEWRLDQAADEQTENDKSGGGEE